MAPGNNTLPDEEKLDELGFHEEGETPIEGENETDGEEGEKILTTGDDDFDDVSYRDDV